MTSVRPIALVHRGRHLAAGILLDDRLPGSGAARRRALALWEPGARVVEVEGGIFLRFARPRMLDAASAPGHLALEAGGCLLAAPLTAAERASLDPPPGSVVVVRAGVAVALAPGAELDPSAWLELEPVLIDVEPLGDPPPAPAPPPQAASPDVRRALSIAPAAPGAAVAQAALSAAVRRAAASASGGGLPARAGRALGGIGAWLAGGAARLASLFTAGSRPGLPSLGAGPASSGLLWVALRQLWQRFLFLTRIARLAGARQGAYVGRLLRMFERGDLGEALRHAIPLGGAQVEHKPIALGVPSARKRLDIEPDAAAPGSSYAFGAELYAEMQRLYRRAFEQLDAQGRVEEAAFVLAELLRTDAEAVSYLERHGRARLAAELAEARGLEPGLVVRQWFLARDVERAVAVARAHGAFADAVDRLERAQKEEARALALCWAEDLAEAGDLETAVRVAAKVPSAGRLAERWTELAVNAGGPAGHALLRAWLELAPERFPQVRERVLAACGDEGPSGPALRAAVARGLLGRGSGDRPLPEVESGLRALARPVVRAMMTDRALGRAASGDLEKLSTLAADGAFEADLPSLRHRPEPKVPVALDLGAGDRGARPALDAAILPCGRILAALGEGGAALLARDGRPIARIDAPAHRLAVSELGTRALALAPRGEAVRISRLDLEARVARPARDLRIRAFAESYDGATWAAAGEGGAFIVDCLRDDLRTLWHVGELGGAPFAVARRATELTFAALGDAGACEGWVYALPGLALRRRSPIPLPEVPFPCAPIAFAGGEWYGAYPAEEGALVLRRAAPGDQPGFRLAGTPSDLAQLAGGDLLAVALRVEAGIEVSVLKPPGLRLMATVRLGGARNAHVRAAVQTVTLADDCGRVVGIDLAAMRVTHDARL